MVAAPQKYPRTPHLPYSPAVHSNGPADDDRVLDNTAHLQGKRVLVTEKMDGECTTLYPTMHHARSLSSEAGRSHPSRSWLKGWWSTIRHIIPEGWRICGEYMYAMHTIHYEALPHYFLVHSIWNEHNRCLSYKDTILFCNDHDLHHVPTIVVTQYDDLVIEYIARKVIERGWEGHESEGIVVRNAESFHFDDFHLNVAKAVKANFVQTDEHWQNRQIIKNNVVELPTPKSTLQAQP